MSKSSKKDNPMTAFMLTNNLELKHWKWAEITPPAPPSGGWDEEYNAAERKKYEWQQHIHDSLIEAIEAAKDGDAAPLVRWIAEVLEPCGVRDVHGILHNRCVDVYGLPTAIHVHIVGRFAGKDEARAPRTLKNVARRLGVTDECIDRPSAGRYGVDNLLSYLTHIKYVDKFQYSPDDVASHIVAADGETYAQIYAERYDDWMNGRGKVQAKEAKDAIDGLIEHVLNGKLTRQQILLDTKLMKIYARFRSKVDDAFMIYADRKAQIVKQEMREGKFRLSVFFVTGQAGNGKSLFAEFFSTALQTWQKEKHGEDWQIYDAAATNGMDDYMGEEILILDDLRGRSMRSEDWLKLLDNHRTSPTSARYRNKIPICKTLIVTSIKDPMEFFDACATTESEDLNQFIRRITATVQVFNVDDNFANSRIRIGETRKVEKYDYNYQDMYYSVEVDGRNYTPTDAVKRLLNINASAAIPAPPPFPANWKTEIFKPLDEETETPQTAAGSLFD